MITLYHYKKHEYFKGVLYINSVAATLRTKASPWRYLYAHLSKVSSEKILPRISKAFLGLATIGFLLVFFPPVYSEAAQRISAFTRQPQVIPVPADSPISEEFFLEIPKINLTSAIIPNVDSANEEQYMDRLKIGVAHAKGSYFPGDNGPIVLFSHSTDTLAHILQYNAKFYALKDLEIGDDITIHFKGKTFTYKVSDQKIINPTQLDTIRQTNSRLILTTCYPPGADWQRLVVFAI